jgi:hypothetical protein
VTQDAEQAGHPDIARAGRDAGDSGLFEDRLREANGGRVWRTDVGNRGGVLACAPRGSPDRRQLRSSAAASVIHANPPHPNLSRPAIGSRQSPLRFRAQRNTDIGVDKSILSDAFRCPAGNRGHENATCNGSYCAAQDTRGSSAGGPSERFAREESVPCGDSSNPLHRRVASEEGPPALDPALSHSKHRRVASEGRTLTPAPPGPNQKRPQPLGKAPAAPSSARQ